MKKKRDQVAAMASLIGGPIRWNKCILPHQLEGEENKPFYRWLHGMSDDTPLEMNCWEVVLFSSCMAGVVDREYIKRVVQFEGEIAIFLVRKLLQNSRQIIWAENGEIAIPKGLRLTRGDLVLFGDDGRHVALATGEQVALKSSSLRQKLGRYKGLGILELDRDTDGVKQSTVEDVLEKQPEYGTCLCWGPFSLINDCDLPPFRVKIKNAGGDV